MVPLLRVFLDASHFHTMNLEPSTDPKKYNNEQTNNRLNRSKRLYHVVHLEKIDLRRKKKHNKLGVESFTHK